MSGQERPSGLPVCEECLHSIHAPGVLGKAFFAARQLRVWRDMDPARLAQGSLAPMARHAGTVSFVFCWPAVRAASLGQGRSCHSIGRCGLSSRTHPSRFTRQPQE